MGLGWLDSLHRPPPLLGLSVPGLLGAGKLGSLPAQFSLASPKTLLLILKVES